MAVKWVEEEEEESVARGATKINTLFLKDKFQACAAAGCQQLNQWNPHAAPQKCHPQSTILVRNYKY